MTFHQAYSSDLKRAFKTCELILEENSASKINSENIVQDERIKEQHFGEFENAKLGDFIAAALKGLSDLKTQMDYFVKICIFGFLPSELRSQCNSTTNSRGAKVNLS